MERYVCIHCHFYQPPRENPWLEEIEAQDSAHPFHDWNERITAECYAPNSAARILDGSGKIARITNNYASISFNFGPTLLSWMEAKSINVYQSILDADRISSARFGGHGNAIAQAYNHVILPLANLRDRETQVRWGIRDFESRFERMPEGMWLPETAADILTLEVLAAEGIKFTILAPHQASRVRKIGIARPFSVDGGRIDPTRAYVCKLPSGAEINLFFYDGPISRAVAFEGLLSNGEHFASRILSGFSESRRWPQLMHIATDGETYGHHHRQGDMALAYALHTIESRQLARITNYGEFLEKHPPTHEAEIIENTAWSCAHGVERWKSDCGCSSGMKPQWHQHWRAPLRHALDYLRDELNTRYEEKAATLFHHPWHTRDEAISIVLDRSDSHVTEFLDQHMIDPQDRDKRVECLKLLEMQRHLMLMYTSCGWFFDELSGIETVQVMMYAGRAIQLANELFNDSIEQNFLSLLENAPTNLPEFQNGAEMYRLWVKPAQIDLPKVGAHYAISSLFEHFGPKSTIYSYDVRRHSEHRQTSGRAQVVIGRALVRSCITREELEISYGALHFGDHNMNAGVRVFRSDEAYQQLISDVNAAFRTADLPSALRSLDRHFEGVTYSLKSLFKDEQQKVLRTVLGSTMAEAETAYRQVYEHHAPLMSYLNDINARMPNVLRVTAEFVINAALRHAFSQEQISVGTVEQLLDSARRDRVSLDASGLAYALKRRLDRMGEEIAVYPGLESLQAARELLKLVRTLPFEVDLWNVQNALYQLMQGTYAEMLETEGTVPSEWMRSFVDLCELAGLKILLQRAHRLTNVA